MEVRYVKEDEAKQIGRIYCESWKSGYKGIIPDDYLDSLTTESCTPKNISIAKNLVILDDGVCVGVCNISAGRDISMSHYGEICALYLLPDYFGKGFARPLFEVAVKELCNKGFNCQYLWVLTDNIRARRFYEKNGFHNNEETRQITISDKSLQETKYVNY